VPASMERSSLPAATFHRRTGCRHPLAIRAYRDRSESVVGYRRRKAVGRLLLLGRCLGAQSTRKKHEQAQETQQASPTDARACRRRVIDENKTMGVHDDGTS
jgi:hypothetical protein